MFGAINNDGHNRFDFVRYSSNGTVFGVKIVGTCCRRRGVLFETQD